MTIDDNIGENKTKAAFAKTNLYTYKRVVDVTYAIHKRWT